jgi:hypothetical protein
MRRWFIALLTLLVAAQLSWAGAALCCVDELAEQQGQQVALACVDTAHADKAGEAHPVCETGHCHCHHAASATPSAEGHALAVPQALAPPPAAATPLASHIPAGLERPNWLRA